MSDSKETIGFNLDPHFQRGLDQIAKTLNEINRVMGGMEPDALQKKLGVDSATLSKLTTFSQTLRNNNKVISEFNKLTSGKNALGLQEALKVYETKSAFSASNTSSRQQMVQKASLMSPAEQRLFKKAIDLLTREMVATGEGKGVKEMQGYGRQMSKSIKVADTTFGMTPKQKRDYERVQSLKEAAAKQALQNRKEEAALLRRARRTNSVVPRKDLSGIDLDTTTVYRAAQNRHIQGLRADGASKAQIREAEKQQKAIIKHQTELNQAIKEESRLRTQHANKIRALGSLDSRALGNTATQFDNQRARGSLGAYRVTSRDENGLQALRERKRLQAESLKIAKAAALLENSPVNERRVVQEKQRLKRLEQMERSLKRQVSYEQGNRFALNPTTMAVRGEISRRQNRERMWGDGGADFFRTQGGLLANYAVMGAGIGAMYQGTQFVLDLDKSFRQLQAILALTNGELTTLTTHLVDVSEKTKFTALEVVDAATTMGQAGFSNEEIRESIESVTLLATAIGTDLKSAVDLQTSIMGVYNKSAEQMPDVTDKIVTAINTSKLNLEKLTLGMQYSGNISSQLGVTFEENLAALSAMANSGIRSGSTLGTGLRQVYIAMQKPSNKFLLWLDEVGLSLEDIDVKSKGLYNVLKTLRDAGFDMNKATSMWETRAASAVGAIFNNMSKFKEMMSDFDNSMGAAAKANEVQMQAMLNQLDRLYSIMGTIVSEGAEPLREAFTDVVMITADFLSNLRDSEALVKAMVTLTAGWAVGRGAGFLFSLGSNLMGGRRSAALGFMAVGGGATLGAAAQAQGIARYLLPLLTRAGTVGMVGAGALAIGTTAYNSMNTDRKDLDRAKTELSENIALYNEQQTAIQKLTSTIYDMDVKQELYGKDQEALRRFTNELNQEFGSLGLILSDVEGDFGKTRQALVDFREGLINANPGNLPNQSFAEVGRRIDKYRTSDEFAGNLRMDDSRVSRLLFEAYKMEGGSWVQPQRPKRMDPFFENDLYASNVQAYRDLLALFTIGESGQTPLEALGAMDKTGLQSANRTLVEGMNTLSMMRKYGFHTGEQGQFIYDAAAEQLKLNTEALQNIKSLDDSKSQAEFDKLASDLQNQFATRGTEFYNSITGVKRDNSILSEPKADKAKQAQVGFEALSPLLAKAQEDRKQIEDALAAYDEANGTDFSERRGDIDVWRNLNSRINEVTSQLESYQKTLEKLGRFEAKQREATIKIQLQEQSARVSQVKDLESLSGVQSKYLKLLEEQKKAEREKLDLNTIEGQITEKELNARYSSRTQAFNDRVEAQRLRIQSKAIRTQQRQDLGLLGLQTRGYGERVKTLNGQLSAAMSTEEANRLGAEIKTVLKEKIESQTEAYLKKLGIDPDSPAAVSLQETQNEILSEQLAQTDTRVSNKNRQIQKGIYRQLRSTLRSALRFEKSFIDDYIQGQSRLAGDQKTNIKGEMSNIYSKMKDVNTPTEEISKLKDRLDTLVVSYFDAVSKQIKLQEKGGPNQAKRLLEMETARGVALDKNQLSVDAALRIREGRLASKTKEGESEYRRALQTEWSTTKKQLTGNARSRNGLIDDTKKDSLLAEQSISVARSRLAATGLPDAAYKLLSAELVAVLTSQSDELVKGYSLANDSANNDISMIQDKLAVWRAQAEDSAISETNRSVLEKQIADAEAKIEQLRAEIKNNDLKAEGIRNSTREGVESAERTGTQKARSGRYESGNFYSTKARIWDGEGVDSQGRRFKIPGAKSAAEAGGGKEGAEGIGQLTTAWGAARNAAALYTEEIKNAYSGYDALTDATMQLVDATDKAVNKAAALATEVVMGAKDGKDAWEDLGKFIMQTLIQIAMQMAINSAASAFSGGGAATGGFVRRSNGGYIPYTRGSVRGQDSIPTLLMPEEYVIRASVARNWGAEGMNAINNGQLTPEDLAPTVVQSPKASGETVLNVWVVRDEKDAGNGGIGPNDVVAIVSDDIQRRGQLRNLIQTLRV